MKIVYIPHPVLAKKTNAVPVEDIKDGSLKTLFSDMKTAMKENNA